MRDMNKKYLVTFTMRLLRAELPDAFEETSCVAFSCYDNAKELYRMLLDHGDVTDCYFSEIIDD